MYTHTQHVLVVILGPGVVMVTVMVPLCAAFWWWLCSSGDAIVYEFIKMSECEWPRSGTWALVAGGDWSMGC